MTSTLIIATVIAVVLIAFVVTVIVRNSRRKSVEYPEIKPVDTGKETTIVVEEPAEVKQDEPAVVEAPAPAEENTVAKETVKTATKRKPRKKAAEQTTVAKSTTRSKKISIPVVRVEAPKPVKKTKKAATKKAEPVKKTTRRKTK